MVDLENRCYLKTLSENDVHELYNRRDNVKIFISRWTRAKHAKSTMRLLTKYWKSLIESNPIIVKGGKRGASEEAKEASRGGRHELYKCGRGYHQTKIDLLEHYEN